MLSVKCFKCLLLLLAVGWTSIQLQLCISYTSRLLLVLFSFFIKKSNLLSLDVLLVIHVHIHINIQ